MISGLIAVIPTYVLLTIGNNAYMVSAITAVVFQMPVIEIKNPKSAIDGIVYAMFTTDIIYPAIFGFCEINIPIDSPIIIAMNADVNVIIICSLSRFK